MYVVKHDERLLNFSMMKAWKCNFYVYLKQSHVLLLDLNFTCIFVFY